MNEPIREMLVAVMKIERLVGLSVIIGIIVMIFPLMLKVLKVERRVDVLRRGAVMNGVLSFAGGLIGLVLFIVISVMNPYMGYVGGMMLFGMLVYFMVYVLTIYLYKKLYIPMSKGRILGTVCALVMTVGLIILLF